MMKILLGDVSDNIPKVFDKVGPKKALKLIHDNAALKAKLKENQASAKQFKMNKQLICFSEIPKELNDRILEKVNEKVFTLKHEKDIFMLSGTRHTFFVHDGMLRRFKIESEKACYAVHVAHLWGADRFSLKPTGAGI